MSLRRRLESSPETVQEFELAAEQKYFEALELMASGYRGAGIYLMGYVAEMLLKVAFFRYDGARPADLVGPRLGPARRRGRARIPRDVPWENYHSLNFWSLLLICERRWRNDPLPARIEARLRQRTRRLYQHWWVEMRYRRDSSRSLEVQTVYDDATWVRDNRVALWR